MKEKTLWIARIVAAGILWQTLYFKLSGAPESVWIFSQLGLEPWGRIGSAFVELILGFLLVVPRTTLLGALGALATMGGAIASHLFILGIVIQNDGGLLFMLAITTSLCSLYLIYQDREKIQKILSQKSLAPLFLMLLVPTLSWGKASYNLEGGFGIQGYDPVSYIKSNAAVVGKDQLKFQHDGVTYKFSSQENLDLFKKEPAKYLPAYNGWCAYAMAEGDEVEINPETFKVINGKTYLFYNATWGNTLKKWDKADGDKKLLPNADSEWAKKLKK